MSANTSIEWTSKSWNPVRGCSRVSAGCDKCYAMGQAHRFNTPSERSPYHGLTTIRNGKVDWTGVARFIPKALGEPLKWRKPQRIFVNSMSDLFHHSVSNEEIAAVFGVMAACPQHVFQILTKRPERAVEWFEWLSKQLYARITCEAMADSFMASGRAGATEPWPLPNVWLGVSVENQKTADERVPLLLKCPAAVRWVSAEPLLSGLDIGPHLVGSSRFHVSVDVAGALRNRSFHGLSQDGKTLSSAEAATALRRLQADGVKLLPSEGCDNFDEERGCRGHRNASIDWVVVGGESGPGARPFDLAWAQSIRDQCREAGVAFFFKQAGARPYRLVWGEAIVNGRNCMWARLRDDGWVEEGIHLKHRKGADLSEIPGDWPREFPEVRP